METKKATIKRETSSTKLVLDITETPLEIILTDDNPNNIKAVFNALLKALKKGLFEFSLIDQEDDLFTHICKEYIVQLNAEIKRVYNELEDYELVTKPEEKEI